MLEVIGAVVQGVMDLENNIASCHELESHMIVGLVRTCRKWSENVVYDTGCV
jgi:hypothetical protein